MKNKIYLAFAMLLLVTCISVVAQENTPVPEATPSPWDVAWYLWVFEIVCLFASVVAAIFTYKNIKGFEGTLANSFKFSLVGLIFIALGYAVRVGEMGTLFFKIPDSPFFPIFVAIGIGLVGASAYIASKGYNAKL
jgi:hypothetical protein